jgi:hypothetical protein
MTAYHDDAEFTDIDRYITSQLHQAAAALTAAPTCSPGCVKYSAAAQDDEHHGETGNNSGERHPHWRRARRSSASAPRPAF